MTVDAEARGQADIAGCQPIGQARGRAVRRAAEQIRVAHQRNANLAGVALLIGLTVGQKRPEHLVYCDVPTGVRLGRAGRGYPAQHSEGTLDAQRPLLPVDVRPAQRAQIAPSGARQGRDLGEPAVEQVATLPGWPSATCPRSTSATSSTLGGQPQ
jgi:hypothetical protein